MKRLMEFDLSCTFTICSFFLSEIAFLHSAASPFSPMSACSLRNKNYGQKWKRTEMNGDIFTNIYDKNKRLFSSFHRTGWRDFLHFLAGDEAE